MIIKIKCKYCKYNLRREIDVARGFHTGSYDEQRLENKIPDEKHINMSTKRIKKNNPYDRPVNNNSLFTP